MLGRLIKVRRDVSVATIENIAFFHEIALFHQENNLYLMDSHF